jgi:hypothetical protein
MAIAFPNWVRPVTNRGYSYALNGQNVNYQPVAGGISRSNLKYTQNKIPFSCTFVINNGELYQAWVDWWFNVSGQGTYKFAMPLDSGNGVEEHTCIAVPGSYNVTGDFPWIVALQVEAEKMPSSLDGAMFDLIQGGLYPIAPLFDRLAQYANEDVLE